MAGQHVEVSKLRVTLNEINRAPRVACAGTIDDSARRTVEGIVEVLLAQAPRSLTLDCPSVVAIDVGGTEALVRIAGRCYQHGVALDVLPSAATGDIAGLAWPYAIGARSFGRTPPGYRSTP